MVRSRKFLIIAAAACALCGQLSAQGFGAPLTMQGVSHGAAEPVASRSAGSTSVGSFFTAGSMFLNPAGLTLLEHPSATVGNIERKRTAGQEQRYSPLAYYSNFSLFMEGLVSVIAKPVYDTINHVPATAADTVQRPFDAIGTDWDHAAALKNSFQGFVAVPFTVGGLKLSVGAGVTPYADLDHYFRNNNVLAPSLLAPEAFLRTRPINDADSSSRAIQWYQHTEERTGSITSFGASVAAELLQGVSLGVSVQMLNGSSDDRESRVERGRLRFYQNFFRAETSYYRVTRTGTSDYSGTELTLSGEWRTRAVTFGASVQLPTIIERSYSSSERTDTIGAVRNLKASGKDQLTLPLRGRLGLSIRLLENLDVALEYAYHPYENAEYASAAGPTTKTWLSSGDVMLGARYTAAEWLILRAGAQQKSETFEVIGNPLPGDAVSSSIYSFGAGFRFDGITLDIGYEYQQVDYVDAWVGALSLNTLTSKTLGTAVTYELPW